MAFTGVEGWTSQFSPVKSPRDLALRGWVKHDGRRLDFAFKITDDVLYGIDTPPWLPEVNSRAHELTREGYPWFGDEMGLLINASNRWKEGEGAGGNGAFWQMVCNLTKSRLGGMGIGGLLEGEPRSSEAAWNTYRHWIEHGAMEAAVRVRTGVKDYVIEWAISFEPCLEVAPDRFYSTARGDRAIGLNIALGDLDGKEGGAGNWGNFHQENWFAGRRDRCTELREWGTLWMRTARR